MPRVGAEDVSEWLSRLSDMRSGDACSDALALSLLWWDWEAAHGTCRRWLPPRARPGARGSLHRLQLQHCGRWSGGTQTWRSEGTPPA